MAQYTGLQERIKEVIRPNGVGAITAAEHQALLLEIVDTLGYDINRIGDGAVEPDGKYPELTAGFANNLVGRGEATEAEFGFRASGGKSIEDGVARVKELQGNTLVWNNAFRKETVAGNNSSVSIQGGEVVVTPTGSYPGVKLVPYDNNNVIGHKYAVLANKRGDTQELYVNFGGYDGAAKNAIFQATKETYYCTLYVINKGSQFTLSNVVICDLTKMFGAGNEPTSMEEMYNRMPHGLDLSSHTEGELISCKADAIKSVNDNAWDEEWEKGYLNNTNGYEQDSEYYIRSKNYNRILAGETYYLKGDNSYIVLYDENKQYLDFWGMPTEGRTIVVDSNARYFKIAFNDSYGTRYKDNVIVSLYHSGYKEGQYIPHKEFVREFDRRIKNEFPNGIKIFDKVYNKNGKGYIKKGTGSVDMGSLAWGYFNGAFYAPVDGKANDVVEELSRIACARYATNRCGNSQVGQDGDIWSEQNTTNVYVKDSAYTDAASFKAAMQGVMLYYELAEPIIIEYNEPFNLDYEVWDFGTEEMLASEPSAPIRGLIAYGFNAVDEIRELRQMLTTLQATIANL